MANLSLQQFNYDGKIINRRESDGYIDLTSMCQAGGKRVPDFLRLKQTQAYIQELERDLSKTGIPQTALVESPWGGVENRKTWAHPTLAINCARWVSPKFAIWCDRHIFTLMNTGKTQLEAEIGHLKSVIKDKIAVNNLLCQNLLSSAEKRRERNEMNEWKRLSIEEMREEKERDVARLNVIEAQRGGRGRWGVFKG